MSKEDLQQAAQLLRQAADLIESTMQPQRFTASELSEFHNPDHPTFGHWIEQEYGVKCPKASESLPRCCGRCDGVNDICVSDHEQEEGAVLDIHQLTKDLVDGKLSINGARAIFNLPPLN